MRVRRNNKIPKSLPVEFDRFNFRLILCVLFEYKSSDLRVLNDLEKIIPYN